MMFLYYIIFLNLIYLNLTLKSIIIKMKSGIRLRHMNDQNKKPMIIQKGVSLMKKDKKRKSLKVDMQTGMELTSDS